MLEILLKNIYTWRGFSCFNGKLMDKLALIHWDNHMYRRMFQQTMFDYQRIKRGI